MSRDFQHPDFGNTGQVRSFGTLQRARHQGYLDLETAITALENRPDVAASRSQAVDAVRVRLERLKAMASDLAHVTDTWQRASTAYADDLDSLSRLAEAARDDLHRGQRQQYALFDTPGGTGGGFYAATAESAEELISAAHQELYALGARRDVTDASYAGSLTHVGFTGQSVNWAGMVDLYAGATSVADIRARRQELVDGTVELVDAVNAGGRTEEDIAALTTRLAAVSADPTLAGMVWDTVGVESAMGLIDNVVLEFTGPGGTVFTDDAAQAAALDFVQAMRASLGAASQTWGSAAAHDAAAKLVTGEGWPGSTGWHLNANPLVGYLFNDTATAPMSVNFAVAMADLYDQTERVADARMLVISDPHATLLGTLLVGDVAHSAGIGGEASARLLGDPMGTLLSRVGADPEAAWSWLDGGEDGAAGDRIGYYSARDWSADGWEGFATLWESSLHADGGLLSHEPGTATWDAQCDAASRIVSGLAEGLSGEDFGGLSEAAGLPLGLAFAELMPFAEADLYANGSIGGPTGTVDHERTVPGYDDTISIPDFDDDALGLVLGQVATTEDGMAALRVGINRTEAQLVEWAEANDAWDIALGRIATIEASFDGAIGGVDVIQGRFDDTVIERKIAVMDELWSLVKLPEIPVAGLTGAETKAIGEAGVADFRTAFHDAVVINEQLARDAAEDSKLCGSAVFEAKVASWARDPSLSLGDSFGDVLTFDEEVTRWGDLYDLAYDGAFWGIAE